MANKPHTRTPLALVGPGLGRRGPQNKPEGLGEGGNLDIQANSTGVSPSCPLSCFFPASHDDGPPLVQGSLPFSTECPGGSSPPITTDGAEILASLKPKRGLGIRSPCFPRRHCLLSGPKTPCAELSPCRAQTPPATGLAWVGRQSRGCCFLPAEKRGLRPPGGMAGDRPRQSATRDPPQRIPADG